MSSTSSAASSATAAVNREAAARYAMDDRRDFPDADRGFIAAIPDGQVLRADGSVMVDLAQYGFLSDDAPAPDTVNPSLWRQSQLISRGGLYQVTDRVYQVRNNDIANLTIIEGDDGLVIVDCMSAVETAAQGHGLFREHVTDKPVAAVIYTHTHIDHYGGVKGVVDPADVRVGQGADHRPGHRSPRFDKFAIGENVIAGNAMSAARQLRVRQPPRPRARAVRHLRHRHRAPCGPDDLLHLADRRHHRDRHPRELAGLEFEFLYAPDTEAPEEMHIWMPELKALTCAENANHALHNIQTLRGARTRDARNFARYLDETLERWGDDAEVALRPAHLAGLGQRRASCRSSSPSATPTSTSTTRPCGWPTRGTRPWRPPR